MAEAAGGSNNIFVFNGEQNVPMNVTHVVIDRQLQNIPKKAFLNRRQLMSVETHDEIEKVGEEAFRGCRSLRGIKLQSVKNIEYAAFSNCAALSDVEFGNKLERVGDSAFVGCPLKRITIPGARTIHLAAFCGCKQLAYVELPDVERIGFGAFLRCVNLQRIAIPLRDSTMFPHANEQRYSQFEGCKNLKGVDLIGGIHSTISSLLLESWRNEMHQEIDRINKVLPRTHAREKAREIQRWVRSVSRRIERYKVEHKILLKEAMAQLELALWKANLGEATGHSLLHLEAQPTKKAKIDVDEAVRRKKRITSGANVVIKNVLPFLRLK